LKALDLLLDYHSNFYLALACISEVLDQNTPQIFLCSMLKLSLFEGE